MAEVVGKPMNYYALVRFGSTQKVFTIPYENNYLSVGDEVADLDGHIGRVVGCCSDFSDSDTATLMSALNWGEPLPTLKAKIMQCDFNPREEF